MPSCDFVIQNHKKGRRGRRPYGKIGGFWRVRKGETYIQILMDFCGQFSWFGEIRVEKCKEKLKIMLDFLLGKL